MKEHRRDNQDLQRRIDQLPIHLRDLPFCQDVELIEDRRLRGKSDDSLLAHVDEQLTELEAELVQSPFLPPTRALDQGSFGLGNTSEDRPIRASIGDGEIPVQHVLVPGGVATGKSCAVARHALELQDEANVIIIDQQHEFSKFPEIRGSFEFVDVRNDLRLNPFDEIAGVARSEHRQTVLHSFQSAYSWQYGVMESNTSAIELDESGSLCIPRLIEYLAKKRYPGFSNRQRYADTARLGLSYCADGLSPLLDCSRGMDMAKILEHGRLVLELHTASIHAGWFIRSLFDFMYLRSRAGHFLNRPLVVIIDEAAAVLNEAGIANTLLTLRHRNVHGIFCVQHPHKVVPEVFGNCDLHIVLGLHDERDRTHVARSLNLNKAQSEYLAVQEKRSGVCFLPRSYPYAFQLKIPFIDVDREPGVVRRTSFLRELLWVGLDEDGIKVSEDHESSKPFDEQSDRFIRDVLNQAHEFSALTQRFERAGIRSASKQGQIIKTLCAEGYIWIGELGIGRGRPVKLVEPTDKALEEFGVQWKKTRGTLLTRAATERMKRKLKRLDWNCIPEGRLGDKQVDLLCRDLDGELATVEIAGSADHEIHNAMHCLGFDEVGRHVVVCINKTVLDEVKKKFSGMEELAGNEKVEVVLLSKALGEKWFL